MNLEAERTLSVLDEMMKKLTMLSYVPIQSLTPEEVESLPDLVSQALQKQVSLLSVGLTWAQIILSKVPSGKISSKQ